MHAEMVYVEYTGDVAAYVEAVKKVTGIGKTIILSCTDVEAAKAALEVCKAEKPILDGANASNYEAMVEVAKAAGVVLGVSGADINELYDTTAAIEKLGYKDLVLNTTGSYDQRDAFCNNCSGQTCMLWLRIRTEPSDIRLLLICVRLAPNDEPMQTFSGICYSF